MKEYDFLIVGAGLYGAVFAHEAKKRGKRVLVIEKRNHIGGNIFTEVIDGIQVHKYGAHIFHTSNQDIWNYIRKFGTFNRYTNSPLANFNGELYNLPFNMNTFYQLWKVKTPEEAKDKIKEQIKHLNIIQPRNLEEQALALVGTDIYYKLIKGYTEKQWGCEAKDLPAFIIKRLPVRFTFDNNYFNDLYQGIPDHGYTNLVKNMLEGIEIRLNIDFFENKAFFSNLADKIVYTGMIDQYFGYKHGILNYRSLEFETQVLDIPNFQGNAVINYTDSETRFTRIIEHKHFVFGEQKNTVVTKEYPKAWAVGQEPYYPINDTKNDTLFSLYLNLAKIETNVIFGGRLADYKYYDMHHVVGLALKKIASIFPEGK